VEESQKRKKKITPPPARPASLKPGPRLMDAFVEGEPFAIAIVEAWNPGRSLARRQTVRHVQVERPSAAARPLQGALVPNADLDALLAEWRRTRDLKDFDTLILSARPYLDKVCRAITRSEEFSDLLHSMQDVLMTIMDAPEEIEISVRAYLYGAAQRIYATILRGQYLTRKRKDEEPMPKFLPLSAADHLTTDDGGDLDSWRERPASAVDDATVAIVAEMLQDGLKVDQVCEALGISRSGLYKRVNRHLARRRSGVVDLNACAAQLHSMQEADDELHSVQAHEADEKIFRESCPLFAILDDYQIEGEIFSLL